MESLCGSTWWMSRSIRIRKSRPRLQNPKGEVYTLKSGKRQNLNEELTSFGISFQSPRLQRTERSLLGAGVKMWCLWLALAAKIVQYQVLAGFHSQTKWKRKKNQVDRVWWMSGFLTCSIIFTEGGDPSCLFLIILWTDPDVPLVTLMPFLPTQSAAETDQYNNPEPRRCRKKERGKKKTLSVKCNISIRHRLVPRMAWTFPSLERSGPNLRTNSWIETLVILCV